jgi:hypothetical protein
MEFFRDYTQGLRPALDQGGWMHMPVCVKRPGATSPRLDDGP